ncbi:hypothetical protein FRC02_006527, partial [Tulasnella sp. 418]
KKMGLPVGGEIQETQEAEEARKRKRATRTLKAKTRRTKKEKAWTRVLKRMKKVLRTKEDMLLTHPLSERRPKSNLNLNHLRSQRELDDPRQPMWLCC